MNKAITTLHRIVQCTVVPPVDPPPAPPAKPTPPLSVPSAPHAEPTTPPLSWLLDEAFRQNRTAIV